MSFIEIYGTQCIIPDLNQDTYVENWDTENPKEQYWKRRDLPDYFGLVEYDKEGNAILNHKQREYALTEVDRCKNGFWFMNCGVPTYITGKHYFYMQWWKLEDDIYADYRDTDRRYFVYLNHWENVPWCLGVIRGKKRREGATSQATSNLIYECVFFRNSICGLVSKTNTDGRTAFTNMVAFGYRQLPVFLKPKQLNNKDSVSELVFAHKATTVKDGKGATIDNDTGHRSKVDYRAASVNAYDSGRLSRGLWDEGGKWDVETPFSKFIAIVSKTMVKGVKRVGFMECPSTVNEMTKSGGAEFKKVWDSADHLKVGRTPNRLIRYFTPAFDGYVGFIDRYGVSVIDAPNEEQYKFLCEHYIGAGDLTEEDIKLGARDYLISKRSLLEGTELEEEIRMNPFDEKEMFSSALMGCLYNSFKINQQLDWLSYNKGLVERGNLVWENGHEYYREFVNPDGSIDIKLSRLIWTPNENGKYEKLVGWTPLEENNVFINNGFFVPNGNYSCIIGCDPFRYDKTKDNRKSDCAAYVYQPENVFVENYQFNDTFVMRYVDRASTTDIQYDHVLRMSWYCGCQVLFERNVDGWKKYFRVEKCSGFLMWLPGEVEPGIYTDGKGNTIQNMCSLTGAYIEKDINKVYFPSLLADKSGWLGFEIENTQKYDDAMAAGFALIASKVKKYSKPQDKNKNIESIMPYRKAI